MPKLSGKNFGRPHGFMWGRGGRGRNSIREAHNINTKRIRPCAVYYESITADLLSLVLLFALSSSKTILLSSEHKTSQPSALVAIVDCSALWLQICHRHICLTRRAPYKGKPRLEIKSTDKLPLCDLITFLHNRTRGPPLPLSFRAWNPIVYNPVFVNPSKVCQA